MNQKVGIDVAATADTSQVEQAINALGQKIAQANRVQYSPVSAKSIEDVKKLNASLGEVLKTQAGLRKRLADTQQDKVPFADWDWQRLYPHAASRGVAMQSTFERVVGPGRFTAQQQVEQPTGGASQPPAGPSGGHAPGMGTRIAQAGLSAAGPAGGVAANALGTGMTAGFGAGLVGLVGGLAALGVGKLVGAVAEKVGEAEQLNVDYDTLKRSLGDVGVEFKTLKTVLQGAANQAGITFGEAGKLGTQFSKLSNLSSEQFKTLGDELDTGVGLSRSFGLDPSAGVGALGQMRGMGITTNTQESRRFALLLGETIGKSGAFAKAEEVFDAIGGYATSQTRNSMGVANVAGYAGMYSAMAGSGIPGMDPAGAAGMLNKINSVLASGGAKGEASQFFTGIVGHRMGLDPFQTQVLREGGAFATNSEAFGADSAYRRYMGTTGPKGGTTFLQGSLDELRNQYQDPRRLAEATSNHLGIGVRQAMALLSLKPNEMGEMQGYAGDLTKMSSKGIGNLSKALYGSSQERDALKADFLGRTGADAISAEDAASLRGAGTDKELKSALATIAAKYDQERTTGSDIRDSKNALDNIKTDIASKLVPLNQAMRDGILFMAGGGKKSRLDVMKDIEDVESTGRKQGIDAEYQTKLKAAGSARMGARAAVNELAEKNRKAVLSGEMTVEEHQRQMAPLLKRERDAVEADAKAREWHTEALEAERKLREKNIENLEKSDAAERAATAPPVSVGGNETSAESARLRRHGRAPAGTPAAAESGYDPLSNNGARVTSGFGPRVHPVHGGVRNHQGIDFGAKEGTAINATADGEVVRSEMSKGGYGNVIEIQHADGSVTRYAHNKSNDVNVGQKVKAGAPIGRVGSTGLSTGPHLHYEVRKNGKAIDPNIAFEAGEHRRPIGDTPTAPVKGVPPVDVAKDGEKAAPPTVGAPRRDTEAVDRSRGFAADLPPRSAELKREGTPAGELGLPATGGGGAAGGGSTTHEVVVRLIDDKTEKPKTEQPVKIPIKVGPASAAPGA